MTDVLTEEFHVSDSELDENGHVNNVVYVHWMQEIAIKHAEINGCTNDVYERLGVSWFAKSHHIDYVSSAFSGDMVVAQTWLADSRKVSCRRMYRFTRQSDEQVLARAETEWVYIDIRSGRPRKIDDEIAVRFTMMGDSPME